MPPNASTLTTRFFLIYSIDHHQTDCQYDPQACELERECPCSSHKNCIKDVLDP